MSSRRAVIVGVGQYRRNPKLDGPFEPWEPAAMMAEAMRRVVADTKAQGDAGADDIFDSTTLLGCVDPIAWNYTELCARVGELAGVNPLATGLTVPPGGNSPGDLLIDIANRIVAGDAEVALLAGSECVYGRRRAIVEVDLSAAVVVMSSDEADRRGIPKNSQADRIAASDGTGHRVKLPDALTTGPNRAELVR